MKLTLLQRLELKITGKAFVGNLSHEGWKGPLPHYVIRCENHGLQIAYPEGYERMLYCSECRKAILKERNEHR